MLIVGLTGGIGSGKSTIAQIFSTLKVPVFNSDIEAKKILNEQAILLKVSEALGENIIYKGKADTKKISSIVFSDKSKLSKLNAVIHPAVKQKFQSWLSLQNSPYVIKEAAILFESGTYKDCDKIILVISPLHLRKKRVLERDGISMEEFELRAKNQWSDEEKMEKSDIKIINDETQLLIPQILKVHLLLSVQ